MTFSYTPAGGPAIWMQFVPARKNTAPPAAQEDNRLTEGMVHTGMNNETATVEAVEKRAQEKVSTAADGISENGASEKTAGPHIPSVDQESQLRTSQLTECEYHQDCIPVGKEQADGLSDDFIDSSNLMTTTDRGRDAVVVEMCRSVDQSGSPVDWFALRYSANSLPKECCVVASGPDGKRLSEKRMSERPAAPSKDRSTAELVYEGGHKVLLSRSRRHTSNFIGEDAPVSRPGCWHKVDDAIARKRYCPSCADDGNRAAPWPCESAICRTIAPQTVPTPTLCPKTPGCVIPANGDFLRQGVTLSCTA